MIAEKIAYTSELRRRHLFSVLTVLLTLLLMAWGAFVTSIDAGLAVPDWPTSFRSWDPFSPFPSWWRMTPVLAEHGHRLLGALVGACTLSMAVWFSFKESRQWMRKLAWMALVLVIFQGMLGGFRVVFRSLDLAIVHACTAQLFLAVVASIAVFTSRSWLSGNYFQEDFAPGPRLRRFTRLTSFVIFLQILLGALLRHPGTGIDPVYVTLHIIGAVIVTALVYYTVRLVRLDFRANHKLYKASRYLGILLIIQVAFGLIAYFVLLDEAGNTIPSNLQVMINSSHLVLGALLWTVSIITNLWSHRESGEVSTEKSDQAESHLTGSLAQTVN